MRRLCAFGAVLIVLACAGPARATLTVSSFSVTPSTTDAGANPDVTLDARFSSADGDSPRDASISLAPGLFANPSVGSVCAAAEFASDNCPASSKIGDGTIVGTAPDFGSTLTLPVGVYLIAPQGSEVLRIGAIAELYDYPVAQITAPIQLRTTPDVGINFALQGIPNSVDGTRVIVNELTMTLHGSVEGRPFTRNPTACTPATTTISIVSYKSASASASSSFTPTRCDRLAYAPRLAASATVGQRDDGVALTTSLTQSAGQSATKSVSLALPSGLSTRLSALSAACEATDLSRCPAVGSATITTPLLSTPLAGKIVLAARPGSLPTIDVVLPPPFALTLVGTPTASGAGLAVSFTGLPDIPISSLQVAFAGGSSSLLLAGQDLCSSNQKVTADLTAHSGAHVRLSPSLGVHGCTGTNSSSARVRFAGLAGSSPRLVLTVNGSSALKVVGLRLPRGLSLAVEKKHKGVKVKGSAWSLSHFTKRGLTLSLRGQPRTLVIKLTAPALRVARALAAKVKHWHHRKLTLTVTVQDAAGKKWTLRATGRAR